VIGTGRQSFSSDNWRPTERQPASPRGGSDEWAFRATARPFLEEYKNCGRTDEGTISLPASRPFGSDYSGARRLLYRLLLFMTGKEIQLIPGIGKVSMAEIILYRDRFIR
jgi:hypothetical protein